MSLQVNEDFQATCPPVARSSLEREERSESPLDSHHQQHRNGSTLTQ